jgi:hypothetical protein
MEEKRTRWRRSGIAIFTVVCMDGIQYDERIESSIMNKANSENSGGLE